MASFAIDFLHECYNDPRFEDEKTNIYNKIVELADFILTQQCVDNLKKAYGGFKSTETSTYYYSIDACRVIPGLLHAYALTNTTAYLNAAKLAGATFLKTMQDEQTYGGFARAVDINDNWLLQMDIECLYGLIGLRMLCDYDPDNKNLYETMMSTLVGFLREGFEGYWLYYDPADDKWHRTGLNEEQIYDDLFSYVLLGLYDYEGRVTGVINGEVREEIPNSVYDDATKTVKIFWLNDSYRHKVVGMGDGTYVLEITSIKNGEIITLNATNIPTSVNTTHQYTIDWDALSLGEEGVTVQVDSEGDGVFEHTFTSDSELTQQEYIIGTDKTPPQTSLNIGEPKFVVNGITYLTSAVPITLTAEDNAGGSGVASTAYRIYNAAYDSGWTTYSQPFYLTGLSDGTYHIDSYSTDVAGNIELTNTVTGVLDNTGPALEVVNPPPGWALQDGVTFIISAIDASGTSSMNISIREADGGEGKPVGFEDLQATYNATTGKWTLFFDTLQLPDGYYVVVVKAWDNLGHIGSITVPYSIRNWAVIELLPASKTNKAGRTMPVKFALRVAASVDPDQPFVYNENLTIQIYDINDPSNILQTSKFGDTSRDYRIDTANELYITNFRTLKTAATYVVEVYRNEMLIDTFEFSTVK